VPAADKAENLATVDDREDDPVAEPVNLTAGAGDGCDSGDDHLLAADPTVPEMINQPGLPGRRLPRPETPIIDQILTEPLREIGL
jgi:hypothetical protein